MTTDQDPKLTHMPPHGAVVCFNSLRVILARSVPRTEVMTGHV